MKSRKVIALVAAALGTTAVLTVGAVLVRADAPSQRVERGAIGAQPDTRSRNWKSLSDDVGILVRDDDRLGLRGRLYVRVDGAWQAVAADGAADILGRLPAK